MKFLVYIFLFLFVKVSFAQTDINVEVKPELPENTKNLETSLLKSYNFFSKLNSKTHTDRVKVQLHLDIAGKVSKTLIVKSSNNDEYDKSVVRLISNMNNWTPAVQNGKKVEIDMVMSIDYGKIQSWYVLFYKTPNNPPVFKGGLEEMTNFIDKNKIYSKAQMDRGIIGFTIVRFFVDSTGKIGQAFVRQSSKNKELDEEAVRLVSIMPNWIPAIENGKRLNKYCDLQVTFGKKSELENLKKSQYNLSNKFFNDGMNDFQVENINGAKENYKKAYELNCYHVDALYNLGVSYFKLNQKDSACVCWNELKTNFDKQEANELIKKYCSN